MGSPLPVPGHQERINTLFTKKQRTCCIAQQSFLQPRFKNQAADGTFIMLQYN